MSGSCTRRSLTSSLVSQSDQDTALLPKAAHDTARYVSGEYRFEILPGVSHWIPDEQPDKLADLLLDWFAAHQAD